MAGPQQQDRNKEAGRNQQQGRVLSAKPISIQFVDTPQDIRDAMHDLTPLLDGSIRLKSAVRVDLVSPTNDGEFLDCTLHTDSDEDRSKVVQYLRDRRIDVTDTEGAQNRQESRWAHGANDNRTPRNG